MLRKVVTVIWCTVCVVVAKECPLQQEGGLLRFTTDLPNADVWVRNGHFAELECCMSGQDDMIWYKLSHDKGAWEIFNISNLDKHRIEFVNVRQVLVFKSAEIEDEGTYMCHPKQNDTVFKDISRKFSIKVQVCDSLARGPYAIAPVACENTICDVGDDLTLPCNAYYGCNDGDEPRLVNWFVSRDYSKEYDWTPVEEFDPRFNVDMVQTGNNAEIRTNLTITGVKEQDFHLRFRCMLASSQVLHGQTNIDVKLVKVKSESPTELETETASITMVAVAAGAFIVFIVLIFIAVTVEQGRRTRRHVSNDIKRKLSGDMRPLAYADV